MVGGCKFPEQKEPNEAGDDSRQVWDLRFHEKKRGRERKKEHYGRLILLSVIAKSVTQVSSSYHDVTVIQLEAVEHPRCRRQQGAYGQGEGQTLHVASSHHFHLQRKTKGKTNLTKM